MLFGRTSKLSSAFEGERLDPIITQGTLCFTQKLAKPSPPHDLENASMVAGLHSENAMDYNCKREYFTLSENVLLAEHLLNNMPFSRR